jgi:membrane protein
MKRLRALFASWSSDRCSRKAAALAYYAVFSLAPLLVIVVAVASFFVSDSLVTEGVTGQARVLLGERGAELVAQILVSARGEHNAGVAALGATALLILGATSAFAELKASLDDIWGVGPRFTAGLWGMLRPRLLSFGLVISLVFLLLVSLLINAALELFSEYFGALLGIAGTVALQTGSLVGSFIVITLLFAVIYKLLPEIHLSWRDVALSALLTASLFMVGRVLIGSYLGQSAAVSVYGTASSLAVLLLWVYYSTMIFFLGAEIIKVWRQPAALRSGGSDAPAPPEMPRPVACAKAPPQRPPETAAHAFPSRLGPHPG